MNYKTIINKVMIVITIVILTLLMNKQFFPAEIITEIKYVHDTLLIKSEPIILEKIKAKIIYIKDTIIESKPFIARIDTIIKYDTIKIDYIFPDNEFNLFIRKKPDTTFNNNIYITKFIEVKRPIVIDIISHTAIFLLGIIIK